jgi:hypothetical protein
MTMTAEAQLKQFIAKFDPAHQTLLRAARRGLRKRMPAANELVYDNYNFFVIGYSPTEKPSDAIRAVRAASGSASSTGRRCAIRRRSCSGRATRRVSSACRRPTSSPGPKWRLCWRRRSPRGTRRCRRADAAN